MLRKSYYNINYFIFVHGCRVFVNPLSYSTYRNLEDKYMCYICKNIAEIYQLNDIYSIFYSHISNIHHELYKNTHKIKRITRVNSLFSFILQPKH